jgi:hypothetical protein
MSRNFRTSVVNKCTECPPTCCQKRSAHAGSFEDLPTLQLRQNRAKSLLATPGHSETNGKTYSTTVVHHPTKVQSNKELVVVHANGELTLDLIEKCEEAVWKMAFKKWYYCPKKEHYTRFFEKTEINTTEKKVTML